VGGCRGEPRLTVLGFDDFEVGARQQIPQDLTPDKPSRRAAARRKKGVQKSSRQPAKRGGADSKQARVVEMLRRPQGATVAAIIKATGWQPHSVRGFFAGVVRTRLGLTLMSEKTSGTRVYRIIVRKSATKRKHKPGHKAA
jgi:Protein of unknown function (DUF3489)